MATLRPNPRSRAASISGSANVVSCSPAVRTFSATGRPRWWCTRKRRSCTRRTRRLACRDGGPVAPRRVGIAVALALRPVLGQVALVVGQVGAVDRDVDAHVGVLGVERGRYAVEARGE